MDEIVVKKSNGFLINKPIDFDKIKDRLILLKPSFKSMNKLFADHLLILSIIVNTFSLFENYSQIDNQVFRFMPGEGISNELTLEEVLAHKCGEAFVFIFNAAETAYNEYIYEQNLTLYTEQLYNFLVKERLTVEQFSLLLRLMVSNKTELKFDYETEMEVFLDLCFRDYRTEEEKMLITMVRDGLTYDELNETVAICVKEAYGGGECYVDCYGVGSVIVNRTHDTNYVEEYGDNIHDQVTAPGQFEVYLNGKFEYYIYYDRLDLVGYQAVVDAFYSEEPSHNYLEFRGNWVELAKYEILVEGGNKYLFSMPEDRYLPEEEVVINEEDVKRLVMDKFMN